MERIQSLLELHSIFLCVGVYLFYRFAFRNKDQGTKTLSRIILVHAGVLLWDMLAYTVQGKPGSFFISANWISNFMLYTMEYIESVLLAHYIRHILLAYARKDYRWLPQAAVGIAAMLFVVLLSNYFTGALFYLDEQNVYHRGPLLPVNMGFQLLLMCIGFYLVLRHRSLLPRRSFHALIFYFIFPILGIALQMLFYGVSFFNIATSVSVAAFLGIRIAEINEENRRRDEILSQTRLCLLNAQMNPHFIFNALNVIDCLMREDVDLAHDALMEFSWYLRETINMDPKVNLVPLEQEVKFAHAYAYIEQLRFGDDLKVKFDIEDPSVMVPALTLEPLVENAIKHGIRRGSGKGTVRVHSYREGEKFVIRVADDGAGFDTGILTDSEKSSRIGLANVRERIRLLCKGTVKIDSEIGRGTCVTISIPEVKR